MKFSVLVLLVLLSACTYTPRLEYEAHAIDGSQFTDADLEKIDKGLTEVQKKERTESDSRSYYLSKDFRHWDILTIEKSESGLNLSVVRLSKYLRKFSDEWKKQFVDGTKLLLEGTTKKSVIINEVVSSD